MPHSLPGTARAFPGRTPPLPPVGARVRLVRLSALTHWHAHAAQVAAPPPGAAGQVVAHQQLPAVLSGGAPVGPLVALVAWPGACLFAWSSQLEAL